MKSVGETMAIGRTFEQAFAKALRSRELDKPPALGELSDEQLLTRLQVPWPDRFEVVLELLRRGCEIDSIHALTRVDPWFLRELRELALDPDAPFAGERTFMSVDTCAAEFPRARPTTTRAGSARPRHRAPRGAARR